MIKFGERPKCLICNEPAVEIVKGECYCRRHIPKIKNRIGKYSGPSDRIKGAYERN